ncbi:MAG TPA: 3-ketoacyl-ACP reductase [Bryobacteraceae bacterium]|nr:3-ketoacyl-ACP reductase [Bryobacteraceae bacterium]
MDNKVTVTTYDDLQCGDCQRFNLMLEESLLPRFRGRVRFIHRDFPLPKHSWAKPAAMAGRRFDEIACGLAAGWRAFILNRIKSTTLETLPERVREYAVEVGVDPSLALSALADETLAAAVDADQREGLARGVAKTPTVFVNGEAFIEKFTLEQITAGIENALKQSKPAAIVTGASRGIGRSIATELARTHNVVATYRGRRDAAESLAAETGVSIFQCDIASREDRQALLDFTRASFGRLDLLINNAGMAQRERNDVLNATEESFDELVNTNLKGPHFLSQGAARWMVEQGGGRIVFVTSISSYAASVNRAEYCISKAGLSMSAALYAARLAQHNVQVFEIRPGVIRTDMIAAVESVYEERIANGMLPQRRMGESADVARTVRAIADGLLDYSTGQILNVDGGFHLRTL